MLPEIITYLKGLFETQIAAAKALVSDTVIIPLADILNVFDGDPLNYNQARLPAIVIEPMDTALWKQNQYYEATRRVKISVLVATKQFYGADQKDWIVAVKKYIQNIMEARDPFSGRFSDNALCGIIDNIQCIMVDNQIISNELYMESIQYMNQTNQGFIGYRADMIIRVFNKQIQRV